jgi:hypothetical protein
MDKLKDDLKAIVVPEGNLTLALCHLSLLELCTFCEMQQKNHIDLTMMMLKSGRDAIQRAIEETGRAMDRTMTDFKNYTLDIAASNHLVQLARLVSYDIGYDTEKKCILVYLSKSDDEDDKVDSCLEIKVKVNEDREKFFIMSGRGIPPQIQEEFHLPTHYATLEELAASLNGGLFVHLKESLGALERPDERSSLAASAVFYTD